MIDFPEHAQRRDPDWLNACLIYDIKDMQERGDEARQDLYSMIEVRNAIHGNPDITVMSMLFWFHVVGV